MLKNYFRIALRQFRNHRVYTVINVLGLAMGICACIVIFLIARFDLSFDKFHPDADRIYRIVGDARDQDGSKRFLNSPFDEMAGIEHDIPGFEAQVGFHAWREPITIPAAGGKPPTEFAGNQPGNSYSDREVLTGPDFFSLFPHEWLLGSPAVLNAPNRVVLAESAARQYFGNIPLSAMIGKTVIYSDSLPVTVAGIVKDWNKLTDLGYTDFISISTAPNSWVRARIPTADWQSLRPHRSQAFVRLAPGTTTARVNAALNKFIHLHHITFGAGKGEDAYPHYYLQPLSAIHYTPDFHPGDSGDDFRKAYLPMLYALVGVAVFILCLAIINFINLSTAQSLQRVREVGIRKVMGSSRKGLIIQFLTETLLLTGVAVILSLLLVRPMLAAFSAYIPPGVEFHLWDGGTLLFLLGITLMTTLLAGYYPARLLSSYLPVLSLKGSLSGVGTGGATLRKALIVFQFAISLVFIIGSLVIARQIRYMRNADKGFQSDAILSVGNWRAQKGQLQLFAGEVRRMAGVQSVIVQSNSPMGWAHAGGNFIYKNKELTNTSVYLQGGDAGFIPFYGIRLIAGRNMGRGDSLREIVINEAYCRTLGFSQPKEAVGQLLYQNNIAYTVVGVVADFHQDSFHETIKPLVIQHTSQLEQGVAIKLATKGQHADDVKAVIAGMETRWRQLFPKVAFQYSFLDDSLTWLYDQETHTEWLMQVAMAITIFISCMGLFGLALFTAGKRAKEIGIRKVLGASVANITLLLSRDFLLLVLVAICIAAPVGWYFAERWLQDFAYRIPMNGWVIAEAGLAAIGVAAMTVSWQAIRAGIANPVKSLRSE